MSNLKSTVKFTYEDYLLLPEDKRYELIEGDIYMVPSPTSVHQWESKRLFRALDDHVTEHALGEVYYAPLDVVLSEEDVVQPAILYISKERSRILTEKNIQGAPDLVVEILSPGTAERDRTLKRKLYARHGVLECWWVSPEAETVQVLTLKGAEYETFEIYGRDDVLRSSLLKGLEIDLQKVFNKP